MDSMYNRWIIWPIIIWPAKPFSVLGFQAIEITCYFYSSFCEMRHRRGVRMSRVMLSCWILQHPAPVHLIGSLKKQPQRGWILSVSLPPLLSRILTHTHTHLAFPHSMYTEASLSVLDLTGGERVTVGEWTPAGLLAL